MSEERKASRLSKLGIWCTAVYLLIFSCGIPLGAHFEFIKLAPLSLNELGDFFAGAFGPLAIFWLVLGFFQQGHELRLQVQELALSVEQQKELVGVSRETLEHERKVIAAREYQQELSAQPKFEIVASGGSQSGGEIKNFIEITNTFTAVSRVSFELDPEPFSSNFREIVHWSNGLMYRFDVKFYETGPLRGRAVLSISFNDGNGKHQIQKFGLSLQNEAEPSRLFVEPLPSQP